MSCTMKFGKKNPPASLAEGNKTKVCLKNHFHKL